MNSISFVLARYWVRRFLILNCHETGIWRLRPRREVKSRWRLLDEKNDKILRRCSSRLLQSSSTCWTFSKASHPLRQLGSAFWSIRWRKALRYVCSERRRWRLMFTRLSGEKCQLILLVFSRIFTVVFLQTCRQWIHSAIHLTTENSNLFGRRQHIPDFISRRVQAFPRRQIIRCFVSDDARVAGNPNQRHFRPRSLEAP